MTRRLLPITAAFATLTLFSCYPYPETPPGQGPAGPAGSVSDLEQQKIAEQQARLKAKEKEAKEKEREAERIAGGTDSGTTAGNTEPKPDTKPKAKTDYPFATAVPGKDGFVFSPYNQKVIDVREIQTGTLVQDPTYPAAEKKYFRVP